jgi:hypothetical protein
MSHSNRSSSAFSISRAFRWTFLLALVAGCAFLVLGISASPRPAAPAAPGPQVTPFNQEDPCAMFRAPGSPQLCAPVRITVKDSVEEVTGDHYCDPPGVLPCNEKKYIKRYLAFAYEAQASGFMLYPKDLSNFHVMVQGTPAGTRIVRLDGYNHWFTTGGILSKRTWHKKIFPSGPATIRIPVRLSIEYPPGEDSQWNLMFNGLDVGTNDDELPTTSGSQLGSEAEGQGPAPWTITPQEMKKIMDAGGFEKTFKWRDAQPDGESYEDHVLTIAFEVGEPCKEKIQIAIKTQDGQDRYCFSEAGPGKLEFTLTADVTPGALADEVVWTLPDVQGSTRTVTPANAKGRTVKVTYTGLPKNNSDFGTKKVVATVTKGKCSGEANKDLRFFFPALAKNNPGGKEPNWFYYWKQTSACVGPARFGGDSMKCEVGAGGHDLGYYRNEAFDTFYNICDLKTLGPDFPFGTWKPKGSDLVPQNVTGIDTFAVACLHENAHYTHAMQWWKKYQTLDKFEDTNRNGIKDDVEQKLDKDGDLVPDSLEKGLGLDAKNKYSKDPSHTYDDEEILCWAAEATWPIGKADKEDWAKPGKQWK